LTAHIAASNIVRSAAQKPMLTYPEGIANGLPIPEIFAISLGMTNYFCSVVAFSTGSDFGARPTIRTRKETACWEPHGSPFLLSDF
jgi:hypothetical protein